MSTLKIWPRHVLQNNKRSHTNYKYDIKMELSFDIY